MDRMPPLRRPRFLDYGMQRSLNLAAAPLLSERRVASLSQVFLIWELSDPV